MNTDHEGTFVHETFSLYERFRTIIKTEAWLQNGSKKKDPNLAN